MLAGAEINGEGNIFVGAKIPAGAVECIAFDARDADALPTKALGLPCFAIGSPCDQGVEAGEEEKVLLGERAGVDDGHEGNEGGVLGVQRVNDVGVASGDGAKFVRVGAGVDASGHGGIGKAEGAGGEEVAAACGMDEELERAASESIFFTGNLLWVGELTRRGDERRVFQDFGGPGARRRRITGDWPNVLTHPGRLLSGIRDRVLPSIRDRGGRIVCD